MHQLLFLRERELGGCGAEEIRVLLAGAPGIAAEATRVGEVGDLSGRVGLGSMFSTGTWVALVLRNDRFIPSKAAAGMQIRANVMKYCETFRIEQTRRMVARETRQAVTMTTSRLNTLAPAEQKDV